MPKQEISVDRQTIRHFWSVGLQYKKYLYPSVLILAYTVCINTLLPYTVGRLLAALAHGTSSLQPYFIAFATIGIIGLVTNRIGFANFLTWQPKVIAHLQEECMNMLLKRGMAFHNNNVSGKLVSDAADYPLAFLQLSDAMFVNIVPFLLNILVGLTLISFGSPLIGVVMLVMSIIAIGSGIVQRNYMKTFRRARIDASKAVTAHLADTIVNIQAVKAFARDSSEMDEHRRRVKKLAKHRLHDWHLLAVFGTYRIAGLLIFEFIFLATVAVLVSHNRALLATGIFAFSYTVSLTNRLFEVGTIMRSIEEALMLAEPITEAMLQDVEVADTPHAKLLTAGTGGIDLNQVGFHYTDTSSENDVFSGLSLQIAPGEKVGLVGPSGGGKTTITKLLLRFDDIQSGEILIDGQNIAAVSQASLRSAIAYVPQESLLFHRTISENISYGNPSASDKEVRSAAKKAYAHDFVMGLASGYETVVGERGVKLSGGQRQRIAIARAILKNAPILILDEATSALDSESEQVIQDALWTLMQDRTAIVIAHRLSTIQKMDRIVVLDKGKISEQGSHDALLASNGLYARLWARQSGGFLED